MSWTMADDEQQVIRLIEDYLNRAYTSGSTTEETLEAAQSKAENARTTNGMDDNLRDAEYYLKARWLICQRKHLFTRIFCAAGGVVLTHFYEGLKTVITEPWNYWTGSNVMRANPGNLNALPGGDMWVKRGAWDGFGDIASSQAKPSFLKNWPLLLDLATPDGSSAGRAIGTRLTR